MPLHPQSMCFIFMERVITNISSQFKSVLLRLTHYFLVLFTYTYKMNIISSNMKESDKFYGKVSVATYIINTYTYLN